MESSENSSERSSTSGGDIEDVGGGKSLGGRGRGRGRGRARGRGRQEQSEETGSLGKGRGARGSRGSRSGRGRGRGRSRSKVPEETVSRSDRERVRHIRKERQDKAKEIIRNASAEKLRGIVLQLLDREPALVFDLCEEDEPPAPPPPPGANLGEWCKCGNCRQMPTDLEMKCCGCLPRNCVSLRDEMDRLVLDPQVLALGQRYHREMLGRHQQPVDNYNRSMRHSGYRNFTLWRHGRLGAGQRRVIPSCCVWRIRDEYPSPTGQYTGFIPSRYI